MNSAVHSFLMHCRTPLLLGALLLAYRFIDLGTTGVVITATITFIFIYIQQSYIRNTCTGIIAESISKPKTFTLWLLRKSLINRVLGVLFALILTGHLLIFIYLANPWYLLVILIDVFVVVALSRSYFGLLTQQLHERSAAIAKEFVVIIINILFLFSAYVTLDVSMGNQLTPERLDRAIVATNERRSQHSGTIEDTTAQRPIELFDSRLPLIAREEIKHSCHPFTIVVRVASTIDLNAKSLRLNEDWGAIAYWAIYVTSLSLLPFLALSLLFRSAAGFSPSLQRNQT